MYSRRSISIAAACWPRASGIRPAVPPFCFASPILLEPVPTMQIGSFCAACNRVQRHDRRTGNRTGLTESGRSVPFCMLCDRFSGLAGPAWWLHWISGLRPGSDQPGFVSEDDRLDPVTEAELAKQAGDVAFDRGFADEQPLGEFGVG